MMSPASLIAFSCIAGRLRVCVRAPAVVCWLKSGASRSGVKTMDARIYKITTGSLWARGLETGQLPYGPVDVEDGFMHFSTAGQLRETLRLHYAGQDGLILCAVETERVAADLKWEPSRGGALFPHLHAQLPISAVAAHYPISVGADGSCELPEEID